MIHWTCHLCVSVNLSYRNPDHDEDVFICKACDEQKGGFTKGDHLEAHSLVRCIQKQPNEAKLSTEGRLEALEKRLDRMEKMLQTLVVQNGRDV